MTGVPRGNATPAFTAVEHYQRRSDAFYRLATEGAPEDGTDLLGHPGAAGMALDAHRILGRAIEAEVFDPAPVRIERAGDGG